jgi:hypothetical protein
MVTGVYAASRNIQTLVDRDQHQESIRLDSAEARNCWLGIGGGMMSFLSGGTMATARAARAATTARTAATMPLAIKSVAVGSSILNGLAVGNGLANIMFKVQNKEEVTALDLFQVTSAVLFFTHSVISTRQAMTMLNRVGNNSSGRYAGGIRALMKRISESVRPAKVCNNVPGVIAGCSPTVWTIAGGTALSLLCVCSLVGRKLIEVTKKLLRGLTNIGRCLSEVRRLLGQFWESWKKEMAEVVDAICRAFGVKHWSELVNRGWKLIKFDHIRAIAGTLIAEKKSLVDCGSTGMPSHQGQAICENGAVVGTGYGPNSLVDGETETGVAYYNEVTNIHANFVERRMGRNPADFCKYMTFICKFVKSQLQKRKAIYEKTWEMVKDIKNVEDFNMQYGIAGNADDHFLQEVFNELRNEKEDAFTMLQLAYMLQNAGGSTQEKEHVQGFLDAEGVRFNSFSMRGKARNGMPSEQQYGEMAAQYMGRCADIHSIFISDSGDTAFILANCAADVMTVQCWPEGGEVSGIAAVLRTSPE